MFSSSPKRETRKVAFLLHSILFEGSHLRTSFKCDDFWVSVVYVTSMTISEEYEGNKRNKTIAVI